MSNIDTNTFDVNLEKELRKLNNKLPPPNNVGSSDIFIRDLNENVKIYQNSSGRKFYHNWKLERSSWKPPRNLKPKLQQTFANVQVPKGYIEHYDQTTGNLNI